MRFLSLFFSSSSGGKMDGEVGEDGEGSISRLDLAIFVNRGTEGTTTTSLTLFDGLIRIVRFPLPRIRPNSIRPRWKLRIRGAVGETPFAVAFSRFERFIVVRRSRLIFRLELFNSWKDALFQETLLEKRFSRVSNESSMYSRAFVYVRKREITRLLIAVSFSNALARSYDRRSTPVQSRERSARPTILVSFTWKNWLANVRPGTTGLFEEYPAERSAEVLVEDGVNERV